MQFIPDFTQNTPDFTQILVYLYIFDRIKLSVDTGGKGANDMTIVKAKEYYEIIASFCRKHELYKVENGELKDNCYIKKYLCEDGSQGTEVNRKVYEKVSVEVKGLKCEAVVELLETEWFDSDSGKSIYMYERY